MNNNLTSTGIAIRQARSDSESVNSSKQIALIADFFNVEETFVKKVNGSIYPYYYYNGKKVNLRNAIIHLYEDPENISFRIREGKKVDYVVADDISVEVKEGGDIFCETLSLDKVKKSVIQFEQLCRNLGYDNPKEINNIALQNFANIHGQNYINAIMSNHLPDYMLIKDKMYEMKEITLGFELIKVVSFLRFKVKILKE